MAAQLQEFPDNCERRGSFTQLLSTGICPKCLADIERIRSDPQARKERLAKLKMSEAGTIRMTTRKMLLDTNQSHTPSAISFPRIIRERETRKAIQVAQREQAAAIYSASPEVLAEARPDDCVRAELVAVNAEFMNWLSRHPDYMRELPPRKFEEVVAAILADLGHTVEITPQTRDGGYDIIASLRTSLGEVLTIVECKRWLPPAKVDLAVVERFIYTLRERTKANRGLIVTTTQFSMDARKAAQDYKLLLKLADFGALKEMASQYGRWQKHQESMLWVPNYTSFNP